MVFLNPAVLLGLIAAAIPILIHLLNLKKLKKIEFSTLRFLKELQKSKIRKIKVKQWLLLVIRVLIIIFLVSAFARPTIKTVSFGNFSSAAKTTSVILLDNSYSMSAVTGNGSLFNQAKKTAKILINNMQNGDEAAVLLSSGNNFNNNLLSTDKKRLINNLNSASISYIRKPVSKSLLKAIKVINKSKNFNKEIFILSDFQAFEKTDSLLFSKIKPDDKTKIYIFKFGSGQLKNLTNSNLLVNNQIFELNKPVSFTSVIKNNSNVSIGNSIISLFINGKRKGQTTIQISPGETKRINFETTLKETGLLEIFTELEDDNIIYDNKYFTSIFVPKTINILIAADDLSDAKFINIALQNSYTNDLKVKDINLMNLNNYDLGKYDILFVIGSENINDYKKLKKYISEKGSLILMPGSKSNLGNFKKLCAELSINPPTSFIKGSAKSVNQFDKIDFKHPVFQNLFAKNNKPKIDSPDLYKYFNINPQSKGKSIITLIDGSSFLSEYEPDGGKILLFNSAPIMTWNDFPVKGLFAPLINKSVYYINSKVKETKSVTSGNPVEINLRKAAIPQIKVVRPDKTEEFINLSNEKNNKYALYKKTDLIGFYKFYSDNKLIDYATVNIDPEESENDYPGENIVIKYLSEITKHNVIKLDADGNFTREIYQSRFGTELWKYFLSIALILALVEMFISKSAKSDLNNIDK